MRTHRTPIATVGILLLLIATAPPITIAEHKTTPESSGLEAGGPCPNAPKGPVQPPDDPRIKWRLRIGDPPPSPKNPPSLYLAQDDLHAVDAATGRDAWRYDPVGFAVGPPSHVGKTVFVGSSLGFDPGDRQSVGVYALNADTGRLRWCTNVPDGVATPATHHKGVLYVGSENGTVYALDAGSGEIQWRIRPEAPWPNTFDTAPAVQDGRVYLGASWDDPHRLPGNEGGAVYAFDATTGNELWRYTDLSPGGVLSGPHVTNDTIYVGSKGGLETYGDISGKVHALNATTGREIWTERVIGHDAYITVDDGVVYAAHGRIEPLNGTTGRWQWRGWDGTFDGWAQADPVVRNGSVFVGVDNRTHAFEVPTGKPRWNLSSNAYVNWMRPLSGEDLLVAYGFSVRRVDPTERRVIWSRSGLETPRTVHGGLVAAAGYLGARSEDGLVVDVGEGRVAAKVATNASVSALAADPDRLYTISQWDGTVAAWNWDSGRLVWQRGPGWGTPKRVAMVDGSLVMENGSHIVALRPRNGSVAWGRAIDRNLFQVEGDPSAWAPNEQAYVVMLHDRLLAFDADTGEILAAQSVWRGTPQAEFIGYAYRSRSSGVVYLASSEGGLSAVDLREGEVMWNATVAEETRLSPPVTAGGIVVVTGRRNVSAADATTGEIVWQRPLDRALVEEYPSLTNPAEVQGLVVIGSADGNVYTLDPRTGRSGWTVRTNGQITTTPLGANGTVYAGSDDGFLYAMEVGEGVPEVSEPPRDRSGAGWPLPGVGGLAVLGVIGAVALGQGVNERLW